MSSDAAQEPLQPRNHQKLSAVPLLVSGHLFAAFLFAQTNDPDDPGMRNDP